MIIFALITLATSLALSVGLHSQQAAQERADELQEVRSLFDVLSRDLRVTYASAANTSSTFTNSGNDPNTLLTFTTLSHNIYADTTGQSNTNGAQGPSGATDTSNVIPQSDVCIVSYVFDPQTNVLSRLESAVPSIDALPQSNQPDTVLSRHVRSIQFQFFDPSTTSYRTDWSYTNDQASATGTGTGTTAGTTATTPAASTTQSGDTTLPQSVQVTIELLTKTGRLARYTTTISLATPTIQAAGQKPETAAPATGAGGTGGPSGAGGTGGGTGGTVLPVLPGTGTTKP
jgi:hypothetical protein